MADSGYVFIAEYTAPPPPALLIFPPPFPHSEQKNVCQACYLVIKSYLRGDSRKNENYLARFIKFFQTQVGAHTCTCMCVYTDTETGRHRQTDTETDRHRQTDTQTDRHRQTHVHTHTCTHTHNTHTHTHLFYKGSKCL